MRYVRARSTSPNNGSRLDVPLKRWRHVKLARPRRWLAGILSRAASHLAPEAAAPPNRLPLSTEELLKLPGIDRVNFEALGAGEVEIRFSALDPLWKGHPEKSYDMIPLRDHMMRLCGVAEEFSNRGYSEDCRAIAENLHLAAAISDLSADTDVYGDSTWCGGAADFDATHSEVAAKYVAGVIVFNLVWGAYEWAVDISSRPSTVKYAKGARGRDLIFRAIGDEHFPCLRNAVLDALDVNPGNRPNFNTGEMRRMLAAGSFGGIAAEYLREFRNALVHGSLRPPTPEDWGKNSRYVADDEPAIRQFHTNIRITLLLIQILLRSAAKENEELTAWFDDPQSAILVLTQLHCRGCSDPFEPGRGNKLLRIVHNGARLIVPSIPKKLLDAAHATMRASLKFEDDEPVIEGEVNYSLRNRKRPIAQRGAEIYSIAQNVSKRRTKKGDAAFQNTPIRPKALRELGPFDVEIYWYNRLVVDAVKGLTDSKQQTRDEIREWAGGPMLFRRGFRILPYGEPDDDWVGLDAKAFGRSGFKLNRQQVIGRVVVTATHAVLSEQTNREGLVESDAAHALRTIVTWLLDNEMRALINDADRDDKLSKREAERVALEFRETQRRVEQTLDAIRKRIGPEQKTLVDRLSSQIALLSDQCENVVGKTDAMTEELQTEREKFVHLAGIGLMTEFIFHELDRAVGHTVRTLMEAQESGAKASLRSLEAQLVTLQKRIAIFDHLAAERRQTKSSFDLTDVVDLVLENHANQFERHGISIEFEKPKGGFKIKAVRGMVIQILENLISNSVYWLKQEKNYRSKFKPRIAIDIDPEEEALTVTDNGPGIDPRRRETIFEPFVTSKPAGQGRGLGLYIARELAQYHDWKLYLDDETGIERTGRLSRFVLDMGGDDGSGRERTKGHKR